MTKKTIIVSGASGNLGGAVVSQFLESGNDVIGIVHRKREILNQHPNYEELVFDLSNELITTDFLEKTFLKYNKIDAVIMTAGGFAMGKITETNINDVMQMYKLNFETAYNIVRPTFIQFKKQNFGKFFFIGSLAGMDMKNSKGVTAYGLSKSLLFNLAKLINLEANNTDISAHVIVPSIIDTPQNREGMPNADFSKWEKTSDIAKIIAEYTSKKTNKLEIIVSKNLL